MKLYRKKLNSIEELKRERLRLRYEQLSTKASDLNPIPEMGKKKKKKEEASSNFMGLAMSVIGAKSGPERLMKALPFLLKRLGKGKKGSGAGSGIVGKVAGDVITNYLIGKAITLTGGLLRQYIRKRRSDAAERKLLEKMQKMGWH